MLLRLASLFDNVVTCTMYCCVRACVVVQVVQQKPIEAYRNTFANLALPLFAMAEPIPAKAFEYKELKWSIWDRWILEGDLTVQVGVVAQLLERPSDQGQWCLISQQHRASWSLVARQTSLQRAWLAV